jgi:PIN domain nuclease of toxin-antitoxin system
MTLLDTHIWLRWIIEGAESLPKSIETTLHDTEALWMLSM